MKDFLKTWDSTYQSSLETIPLFDANQTSQWSKAQQQLFIKLLYHQRGHFDDILWFIGNFAPDAQSKEVILENIKEEFGNHAPSHEKLYLDFAKSHGVDLTYELLDEQWYLPFLRQFNHGILRWFREHDWEHRILAFAAIEHLDNLDYPALKNIAVSFGTPNRDLIFFNVHIHVTHYENIEKSSCFGEVWVKEPEIVTRAFDFIGSHYLETWRAISKFVFAHEDESVLV